MKDPIKKSQSPSPPAGLPLAEGQGDLSNLFTWGFCAFIFLFPLIALALTISYASREGQNVTQDRIRFIASNAITLTGFEGTQTMTKMPIGAQIAVFSATFLGALFTLFLGGASATRILNLSWSDRTVFFASLRYLLLSIIVGAFLTDSQWTGLSPFMASLSAFSNSGLLLSDAPASSSWKALLILAPLSFLGSLGIIPLLDFFARRKEDRPLLSHTRALISLSAVVYLGGFALIFLSRWLLNDGRFDLSQILSLSTLQPINARATGFNYEFAGAAPRATQWIYLLLMAIGAGPGSFAGGFGLTTLLVIGVSIRKLTHGENPGKAAGLAFSWACWFIGLVLFFFLAMVVTCDEVPADRILFETVSALCNAGLSHDRVVLVRPGLDILTFAMIAGRLAPLVFLWHVAVRGHKMDVLVG